MKKLAYILSGFFILFLVVILISLPNEQKPLGLQKQHKICLNMIVKDESAVIEQCLASVKGLFDYWVIVDTGSKDGTQQIIRNYLKNIPGELYERPWKNFEHNRNEALSFAKNKAMYTLFMDADEVLVFAKNFTLPDMTKDIYSIQVKQKDASDSIKWFMVKNSLDWKWQGVLHETIVCPEAKTQEMVRGVSNYSDTSLGARSKDPNKYRKDAAVLEEALKKEPDNSRYRFYLASSYLNAEEIYLALENYQKRAAMQTGEAGEAFISQFMVGRLQEACHMPPAIVIKSYKEAVKRNPKRAEPFFYLGCYYLNRNQIKEAYEIFKQTPTAFDPSDTFFTQSDIYDWRLAYMTAKATLSLQKYEEMEEALLKVAANLTAPKEVREETQKNLAVLQTMLH